MHVGALTIGWGKLPKLDTFMPSHKHQTTLLVIAIATSRVWENGECSEVNTQPQSTLHQYLIFSNCFECNWFCLI